MQGVLKAGSQGWLQRRNWTPLRTWCLSLFLPAHKGFRQFAWNETAGSLEDHPPSCGCLFEVAICFVVGCKLHGTPTVFGVQVLSTHSHGGPPPLCNPSKPKEWTELDNTWEEALRLRHLLYLAAKPDFVPPARFQQAMETCVECLLAGSGGSGAGNASLLSPERLLQLLDSPDALPLLQYLSWLEEALKEITSGDGPSGSSFRTVLVPQRAKGALKSWPAERSLLQQSACALWEALLLQGPKHLRQGRELGAGSWELGP
ncbi:unnamed protein product, partial [Effrenium voratum]